jgi:hypothetical protein
MNCIQNVKISIIPYVVGLLYFICVFLKTLTLKFDLHFKNFNIDHIFWMVSDIGLLYFIFIGTLNFDILTLSFDDDGHLWNLSRTGAFVFHNTSCLCHKRQSFSYLVGVFVVVKLFCWYQIFYLVTLTLVFDLL